MNTEIKLLKALSALEKISVWHVDDQDADKAAEIYRKMAADAIKDINNDNEGVKFQRIHFSC